MRAIFCKLALASVVTVMIATRAFSQFNLVEGYIHSRGGCDMAVNWEQEFRRTDQTPFGKHIFEWNNVDYLTVRAWLTGCVNRLTDVPSQRNAVLFGAINRLEAISQAQKMHAQTEGGKQERAAYQIELRQALKELKDEYASERAKYLIQVAALRAAAESFVSRAEKAELEQLEALMEEGKQLRTFADAVEKARRRAAEMELQLSARSVPIEYLPSSDGVRSFDTDRRMLELLRDKFNKCGEALRKSGVPEKFIRMRVQSNWIERNHPFLFELICPEPGQIRVSPPSWLSRYLTIEGRSGNLVLDLEPPPDAQPGATNENKRLVARRLRTRNDDLHADTNLEAGQLAAKAMSMFAIR